MGGCKFGGSSQADCGPVRQVPLSSLSRGGGIDSVCPRQTVGPCGRRADIKGSAAAVECGPMELPAAWPGGRSLPCGAFARWRRGA